MAKQISSKGILGDYMGSLIQGLLGCMEGVLTMAHLRQALGSTPVKCVWEFHKIRGLNIDPK